MKLTVIALGGVQLIDTRQSNYERILCEHKEKQRPRTDSIHKTRAEALPFKYSRICSTVSRSGSMEINTGRTCNPTFFSAFQEGQE